MRGALPSQPRLQKPSSLFLFKLYTARVRYSAATSCSAASRSTETSFETPCSRIVTPKRRSMRLIVTGLWVITTKRVSVRWRISFSMLQKRSTLASSSGASTSSSTQMGAGRERNTAKISAAAVRACSPPDMSASVPSFLPGGWAKISRPAFRGSSASTRRSSAWPPRKRAVNRALKCSLTVSKAARRRSRPSALSASTPSRSLAMAAVKSSFS